MRRRRLGGASGRLLNFTVRRPVTSPHDLAFPYRPHLLAIIFAGALVVSLFDPTSYRGDRVSDAVSMALVAAVGYGSMRIFCVGRSATARKSVATLGARLGTDLVLRGHPAHIDRALPRYPATSCRQAECHDHCIRPSGRCFDGRRGVPSGSRYGGVV